MLKSENSKPPILFNCCQYFDLLDLLDTFYLGYFKNFKIQNELQFMIVIYGVFICIEDRLRQSI